MERGCCKFICGGSSSKAAKNRTRWKGVVASSSVVAAHLGQLKQDKMETGSCKFICGGSSSRAAKNRTRWKGVVASSSVVAVLLGQLKTGQDGKGLLQVHLWWQLI